MTAKYKNKNKGGGGGGGGARIENMYIYIGYRLKVQELYESRGGRPGLSVLTSLLVSVDVKIY